MSYLFLLTQDCVGWDEMSGCVVRAKSPSAARKLASTKAGDEGEQLWLDQNQSKCEVIDRLIGQDGIIIIDFKAG